MDINELDEKFANMIIETISKHISKKIKESSNLHFPDVPSIRRKHIADSIILLVLRKIVDYKIDYWL